MKINLIKNSNNNIKNEEIDELIFPNINDIIDGEIEDHNDHNNNSNNINENNEMIENQSNYEESECQEESDFNNDIIEDINENKELEFNVIDNLKK